MGGFQESQIDTDKKLLLLIGTVFIRGRLLLLPVASVSPRFFVAILAGIRPRRLLTAG